MAKSNTQFQIRIKTSTPANINCICHQKITITVFTLAHDYLDHLTNELKLWNLGTVCLIVN